MTKRRLAPKEQQLVEDYLTELNKLQSLPIFDKMLLTEVVKYVTSALQERADMRERAVEVETWFPVHLVVAHAKYLTGKWFDWRITVGDTELADADLTRMYRSRRKAE